VGTVLRESIREQIDEDDSGSILREVQLVSNRIVNETKQKAIAIGRDPKPCEGKDCFLIPVDKLPVDARP
jgi:hypothetical protein